MDNLTYHYQAGTNKLTSVSDAESAALYDADIDNQPSNNYKYDAIGNMVRDQSAGINKISWTVYGKIRSIQGTNFNDYGYDAGGNRIRKTSGDSTTYYVRDATGNQLAMYKSTPAAFLWDEQGIYGSERTGLFSFNNTVPEEAMYPLSASDTLSDRYMSGGRVYELTNHLGNVLSTLNDKKTGVISGGSDVAYYEPEVLSQNDYYPFGMLQPGRRFAVGGAYRYGFNGKENDNEVKGEGNQVAFEARVYDPSVGRFLSTDPLEQNYLFQSTYVFAANNPIRLIDEKGMGPGDPPKRLYTNTTGAKGIIQNGFKGENFGKFSSYNWFSAEPNAPNTGRAGSGVTLGVEGIDVSNAHEITKAQTTAWRKDAMKELGFTDESLKSLQRTDSKAYGKAMSTINGSLYSKVGAYMDKTGASSYYLAKDGHYAVSDAVANGGTIMTIQGSKAIMQTIQGIKIAGKALTVVNLGLDLYEIHTSGYEARTITSVVGGWAGAWAGAAIGGKGGAIAGAWAGSPFAGVGAGPGALIGGFVGSLGGGIAGYFIGREVTETIYDYVTSPGVKIGDK